MKRSSFGGLRGLPPYDIRERRYIQFPSRGTVQTPITPITHTFHTIDSVTHAPHTTPSSTPTPNSTSIHQRQTLRIDSGSIRNRRSGRTPRFLLKFFPRIELFPAIIGGVEGWRGLFFEFGRALGVVGIRMGDAHAPAPVAQGGRGVGG